MDLLSQGIVNNQGFYFSTAMSIYCFLAVYLIENIDFEVFYMRSATLVIKNTDVSVNNFIRED